MVHLKLDDGGFYGPVCKAVHDIPVPTTADGRIDVGALKKDFLHCDVFDIVHIGNGMDIWVDDEGLCKKRQPRPNWIATALITSYWSRADNIVVPCFMSPLVGDCVVLASTEDGDTVDLSPEQAAWLKSVI